MKKPGWFFALLKIANRLRLVNSSIFKFVNYYIGNDEARTMLYNRWITLRKFKPSINICKKNILTHQTPVNILYGKHDRIILPVVGERFKKGLETLVSIHIISSGHQVLHEKHAEEITQALLT